MYSRPCVLLTAQLRTQFVPRPVEQITAVRGTKVWIGVVDREVRSAVLRIVERRFRVDAFSDIYPVGKVLGGRQYDLRLGDISRVEVDRAPGCRCGHRRKLFFELYGMALDAGKVTGIDQALKEDEPPAQIGSHLVPVIVRMLPWQDLALHVHRAKGHGETICARLEKYRIPG